MLTVNAPVLGEVKGARLAKELETDPADPFADKPAVETGKSGGAKDAPGKGANSAKAAPKVSKAAPEASPAGPASTEVEARNKLTLAQSYLKAGLRTKGQALLREIIQQYPGSASAKEAGKLLN